MSSEATEQDIVALLPRLRRFAYALTGSRDDGDDLVQGAAEKALSRLHQWQPGTRLDSWLFRIAQNLWRDQLRARKTRGPSVDPILAEEIEGEDGRDAIETQMLLEKTRRAVGALPEEQREVIVLVSVEGFSYKEAAETLDIPIGTIMSRLARARKTISETVLGTAGLKDGARI